MSQAERVIIITGAAGGIGRALVDVFAANGDTVVAVDLPGSGVLELVRDLGPAHLGLEADISREEDILALHEQIEAQFPQIGVLVNNASVGPTLDPIVNTTIDAFRSALAVNLIGPYVMAREAARRMQRGGVIVNVALLAGLLGNPRRNAYAASKAGLISITRSLACELAPREIRVTAVAPGYVRTPMVEQLERVGETDLAAIRRRVPMGRMARPDEIAWVVRFLASPQAACINGSVLTVDGGWMSFNQPGDAHPPVYGTPEAERSRPAEYSGERIVLVTGGANGIGAAVVRRFAANGDTVVIADREGAAAAKLAGFLGGKHMAKSVDIAVESDVVALFEELRARFGRLDLLVNATAGAELSVAGSQKTTVQVQRVLDVNLTGVFTCAREAIKMMRPGSVILNVGSMVDFLPLAQRHAYEASMSGTEILTRCLAAELGPVGIRTASIAPGYIRPSGGSGLAKVGSVAPEAASRRIPIRTGEPEDVAEAAFFLASPEASYVNGSTLCVDGGCTSLGDAGFESGLDQEYPVAAAKWLPIMP
ncbi:MULTISPECIES: SDR family oxidoreductase [Sinorhizobium]|uniref:Short-chain dehydrogenase n=1 Tax=Sinorhizobium americanum TaxID=194963 RepID=A0A2S3YR57_9HYPH|nr:MULTISPECIES: SDR family oxidoreductase [Sinorhizobium]PDT35833.1 short-chain dehydrogenase [Sinorhizobium sp. FG01]PDT50684.1 short-chain dehydrogenase [Sinorhizobium sp. NG07B]POH33965.1 short-chain dehydrogenase [Sinorhizobium americanum]POH33986.1 short-chain dehydrogenase [Sinorhizobium americanum]